MEEETATQLIPPFRPGELENFKKVLLEKVKGKAPTSVYRGSDVYKLGDDQFGYVILVEDGEVVYFVRYKRISHNNLRLGRQVLLWRSAGSVSAGGFAKQVFFKYLLPKFGSLIADQQQTQKGADFWSFAIGEAFEQDLYVYFLDRRSTPNRLIQLFTSLDVKKYRNELWGPDQGHKRTFAVISQKPLKIVKV